MTQRSAFQIQVLEKLAAPLLATVGAVAARESSGAAADARQEAEKLAELLNKAVQAGVALATAMDLKDTDGQGDAARLALTALAGTLVAGLYRASGRMPAENDVRRLIKALEAALTFSDSFAPAAMNTARLENLAPGAVLEDETQINIQYIGVMTGVVNTVAGFSFGRPENVLVQEIAERLVKKAAALRESILPAAAALPAKQAELKILQALAQIYVECHQQETAKLMAMDDQARAAAQAAGGLMSMEPVWQSFERRAAMAEIIGRSAVSATAAGGGAVAPAAATKPPAAEKSSPPVEPPMAAPPAAPSPVQTQNTPPPEEAPPEDQGSYNPMGFFKPKSSSAGDGGQES